MSLRVRDRLRFNAQGEFNEGIEQMLYKRDEEASEEEWEDVGEGGDGGSSKGGEDVS